MEKRKMIWENKGEAIAFEKLIVNTMERCNSLIETFELFQDWKRIESLEDWIELISNPQEYFDSVLLASVNLSTGGRQADPKALARLVQIDRESYLNIVAGKPIAEGCKPCQKMKLKKGTSAISLYQYQSNQDYLTFDSGRFYLNGVTIAKKKEDFKIYADTPSRIEVVNFWQSLCNSLNQYHDKYHINNEDKRLIGKALKLQLSEGFEGTFVINNHALSNEILNTK